MVVSAESLFDWLDHQIGEAVVRGTVSNTARKAARHSGEERRPSRKGIGRQQKRCGCVTAKNEDVTRYNWLLMEFDRIVKTSTGQASPRQ